MPSRLPTRSQKCRETRPSWAALLTRLSGRSRLLRNDPSTISSPAPAAADPDKPGRPRSDRQPHNHSPPDLTRARVQISGTLSEGQRAIDASRTITGRPRGVHTCSPDTRPQPREPLGERLLVALPGSRCRTQG